LTGARCRSPTSDCDLVKLAFLVRVTAGAEGTAAVAAGSTTATAFLGTIVDKSFFFSSGGVSTLVAPIGVVSTLSTSCSVFRDLPLGVVLIVFSNDPLNRFVLGISSIEPCLVGLASLEAVLDVLAEAELSSGLSGTISVKPNNLGLRFFMTFRSYESLWRKETLASRLMPSAFEPLTEAAVIESIDAMGGVYWAPVSPVISVTSSDSRARVCLLGGDLTEGKHCAAKTLVLFVNGVDLMGLLRDCRAEPGLFNDADEDDDDADADTAGGAVKGRPSKA
jgi:hypothetical protein